MKVILNTESLFKLSGGIGNYTRHLLSGLLKSRDIDKVNCYSIGKHVECPSETFFKKKIVGEKSLTDKLREKVRSLPFVYDIFARYRGISFYINTRRDDDAIYHEPNIILKPFVGKTISTIHDLSHLNFPQFHPKERVRFMSQMLDKTINQASHIITDSPFIRNEIIEYSGISSKRITAIPLGVDENYHPYDVNDIIATLAKYKLQPNKYLLSVSTIEPRKNIEALLDAYMNLGKQLRREYPLVLVGSEGWNVSDLMKRIDTLVGKGEMIRLGYVSDYELPFLYSGAYGFAYVPVYEGFGLPPLEALACGTPVLTSNVSSIPDVVGNAAILVNPYDVDGIKVGLERLLTDSEWRADSILKSPVQAKKFSWDNCVDETINVYKRIS